jgi:hypothetical protein
MKFRDQKAVRRGQWKWLSIEGDEFLFDLSRDARERANLAKREPEKFAELKSRYAAWDATLPPIPADALVSVPFSKSDLATPS